MTSILARTIFITAFVSVLALFTLGNSFIRIETSLQDLNPDQQRSSGLKFATETLAQDIGQRFIVVVKGAEASAVRRASMDLQLQLSQQERLLVLSEETTSESYLDTLAPYRFNLLTKTQLEALLNSDGEDLSIQAQRKLYQLGDGIRLIPFEQDPLGWFSDFLLSQLDKFSGPDDVPLETAESEPGIEFDSFTVSIRSYPQNMLQQQQLYQAITRVSHNVSETHGVVVLKSGMFFFAVDSAQSAKGDIQLIAIGSTIGVIVLMLAVFRSLLPLALSLSSIAIGVGFGILTSTLVFGSIHILTIVFGASLIGIVVDYSLHYFYHFLAIDDVTNTSKQSATTSPDNSLFRAMLLSVITSLIGYGALAISDMVLLQKVALFSCSGLLLAWLSVMVLGPFVTKRAIVARQNLLKELIRAIQFVFARYPDGLKYSGLLLAVVGGIYLVLVEVKTNDDPRLFFHVSTDLIEQEKQVAELTQVFEPGRFFIVQGDSNKQIYQTLKVFYQALGERNRQVTSVLDWLPGLESQKQNYDYQNELYKDGGVLDQFFMLLGAPTSQSSAMKQAYQQAQNDYLRFPELMKAIPAIPPLWVEHEDTIYSFVLVRKNSDLEQLEAISESIDKIQYVNSLGNAMEALQAQRVTGAKLLLVAYGLIAALMLFYYRKWQTIFLLLIPMTASIMALSILAFIGQAITVFHIMALFLVLGLGMDYIIFAKEMTNKKAITQQAILLSAVTSLLSFGLLAFSSMPIVQAFGSTILIANSINFIAALCLFNSPQTQREPINV